MKSISNNIFLRELNLDRWFNNSYLYRLITWFAFWREGSWLLQFLEPIGACLISSVFILAPFVSTSLIGFLLIAIAGYWTLSTVSEYSSRGLTPIHGLVLIYWVVATLALAFSPVKSAAFSGWITLTLYLLMFALASRILRSPKLTNWIITSFLLTALIVSGYGVRQQFFGVEQLATWNDPNSALANDTRVYSYLGNPNLLGGYLLGAIAFSSIAILIWKSYIQKALAITMLGINSACLFFTDSRGAWLAAATMFLVLLVGLYFWWREYLPRFWQVWLLPLVFSFLGGFALVAILGVESIRLRFFSIFAGRSDSSNNFRINVWEAVFKMIRDYPITGIGTGNDAFNAVYPRYMDPKYPALSAYSVFLEHLVEMGFLGLTCFLWLITVTINYGITQIDRLKILKDRQGLWLIAAFATICGMLVHGVVDTVWYRPQISTLWWLMLAILASQYNFSASNLSENRSPLITEELKS